MSGTDRAALDAALREARTVMAHSLIPSAEERWLYTIHFSNEIAENVSLITEEGGTMLAASARAGMWTIRLRFPAHANASRVYERLRARDIQIEITQLRPLTTPTADDLGLTPAQYEAHGYFAIPREISVEELAAKLDISQHALSERFRRAYRTLVASSLEFDARRDFAGGKPSK